MLFSSTRWAQRRTFPATAANATKLAVLGSSGGIGQPLSLLLKLNPRVSELALHDVVGGLGVAADISHVNTLFNIFVYRVWIATSKKSLLNFQHLTKQFASSNFHDLFCKTKFSNPPSFYINMSEPSTHGNLDGHRQRLLPHPDHPQDGHTHMIHAVSLQGDYLVSVSADRTARVWDLRTQRLLYPALSGHIGSVTAVQFDAAAHNDMIITGGADGNVMVWRFSTGEAVKTIVEAHSSHVLCLHFDDRYLVTGDKDGKIKLWNRHSLDVNNTNLPGFAARPTEGDGHQEYSLLAIFDGHDKAVLALKLKDNVLVSGSGDSSMCIWSLQTGEILQRVNIHQSGVACLQYNGRFIVSGSTDNSAKIYDVDQHTEIACLEGHTNLIRSVQAVSADNAEVNTIVTGSYDGSIRFWEQVPGLHEWRTQQQFHISGFQMHEGVHSSDIFSNRISSVDLDAERLVCAGHGPIIRVWDFHLPCK